MFFRDLTRVLKKAESQSAITIIAGDLNSKVGKRQEPEMRSDGFIEIGDKCLGRYSRNIRNGNGNALIEFCETNDLFIANNAFRHPARHQTTWASTRTMQDGRVIRIFNQIDFIICKQRDRTTYQDSRSYAGTKVSSDHRLVVGRMRIKWQHIMRRRSHNQEPKINGHKLRRDNETREKYRTILTESLNNNNNNNDSEDRIILPPQERWNKIRSTIQKAGIGKGWSTCAGTRGKRSRIARDLENTRQHTEQGRDTVGRSSRDACGLGKPCSSTHISLTTQYKKPYHPSSV